MRTFLGLRKAGEGDIEEKVCYQSPHQSGEVDKVYLKHSRKSLDAMMLVLIRTLTSVGRTLW